MMDLSGLLVKQGQLFLLLALGLLFKRKNILDDDFRRGLTELIIKLVLPCSILQSFRMEFNGQVLRQTWEILVVSTVLQLGCWLLALVLYRRQEPSKQPALQYATLCSNAAFLGSPVVDGIFGSQGLLLSSIYLTPQRIAMWTVGLGFFTKSGGQKLWKKILGNPCIDAVFLGLALMLTQWRLPQVLGGTIQAVGGCNTALSMFLIGMICGDVKWPPGRHGGAGHRRVRGAGGHARRRDHRHSGGQIRRQRPLCRGLCHGVHAVVPPGDPRLVPGAANGMKNRCDDMPGRMMAKR